MGTDIRVFEEVKVKGVWHNHRRLLWPRNYTFFGFLANVREPVDEPVAADRGLPEDVTELVKYMLRDEHSVSWCTQDELFEAKRLTEEKDRLVFGQQYKYDFGQYGFVNEPDLYDDHFDELENYEKRFVFGFDC